MVPRHIEMKEYSYIHRLSVQKEDKTDMKYHVCQQEIGILEYCYPTEKGRRE